ncbi:MAG TPA: FAD-dependent oxidoreductase [Saprospiraceae bacterium]|nr:FAD-dependent oxidoreductase [Saprospiraceae bacterium]
MERKFEIIGHGIAGCVLALTLYRRGIPFTIKGSTLPGEASMASSGLINPVTGRRYVKAWMIDELLEKATEFYKWTEQLLGNQYFFPVDIIRFLSNHDASEAWNKRMEDPGYGVYISNKRFEYLDDLQKPYGIVIGGYRLDTPDWLKAVRNFLSEKGFLQYCFEPITDTFVENVSIIYATGAAGTTFSKGMIPNKGEAIIVRIPGWKLPGIIKEKIYFIPLKEKNLFWVGSYYQPWPEHAEPTNEGKELLLEAISEVYSGEVELIDHLSGIRPTVDDRRPLVGPYPGHTGKYLFNGMGTKGTSLAPFWAEKLVSHIIGGESLPRIVDPSRYAVIPG